MLASSNASIAESKSFLVNPAAVEMFAGAKTVEQPATLLVSEYVDSDFTGCTGEVWYRFEDDKFENGKPRLLALKVLRSTKCGVWLDYYGVEKLAYRNVFKTFASPDIKEAAQSYLARKRKQLKILKSRLSDCEGYLKDAINVCNKLGVSTYEPQYAPSNFTW